LLQELVSGDVPAIEEVRHVIPAFDGAWPYLELIASCTGHDPLDPEVVEAYWLGSLLLEDVDLLTLGNSVDDRFRRRAGWDWPVISEALDAGGRPTHSFHVFCVYPWVGLLRSGVVEQALNVLDRCRIRWGRVTGRTGDRLLVKGGHLVWDDRVLRLGPERVDSVLPPVQGEVHDGDLVAMHWDYVCQRITSRQQGFLARYHRLHLEIVNRSTSALESRLEA
jgi:hypothetical protein